jgi:hypothetical protein
MDPTNASSAPTLPQTLHTVQQLEVEVCYNNRLTCHIGSCLLRCDLLLPLQGVNIAYLVTFLCYFGVAIAGYAVFGNAVADNVLESIGQPLSLISLAEMCVVLHVAAACQVIA